MNFMNALLKSLQEVFSELPPMAQAQVIDFAEYLAKKKQRRKPAGTLKQTWANALHEYSEQYTAIELQKKSLDWRCE